MRTCNSDSNSFLPVGDSIFLLFWQGKNAPTASVRVQAEVSGASAAGWSAVTDEA